MINFLVVVHGKVYSLNLVADNFPTLRNVNLFDLKFTKVFAEDLNEAYQIKDRIPNEDLGVQGIHRRKAKLDYKTYWDIENVYIFTDCLNIPNLK